MAKDELVNNAVKEEREEIIKRTKEVKREGGKEIATKVGQFIGGLAVHMAMAGGRFELDSLIDEPLGGILEICFKNGISFEIRSKHITYPTFSPVFGGEKEEVR